MENVIKNGNQTDRRTDNYFHIFTKSLYYSHSLRTAQTLSAKVSFILNYLCNGSSPVC